MEALEIDSEHSVGAESMKFSASNLTNSARACCLDLGPAGHRPEWIDLTFGSAGCIYFIHFLISFVPSRTRTTNSLTTLKMMPVNNSNVRRWRIIVSDIFNLVYEGLLLSAIMWWPILSSQSVQYGLDRRCCQKYIEMSGYEAGSVQWTQRIGKLCSLKATLCKCRVMIGRTCTVRTACSCQ